MTTDPTAGIRRTLARIERARTDAERRLAYVALDRYCKEWTAARTPAARPDGALHDLTGNARHLAFEKLADGRKPVIVDHGGATWMGDLIQYNRHSRTMGATVMHGLLVQRVPPSALRFPPKKGSTHDYIDGPGEGGTPPPTDKPRRRKDGTGARAKGDGAGGTPAGGTLWEDLP